MKKIFIVSIIMISAGMHLGNAIGLDIDFDGIKSGKGDSILCEITPEPKGIVPVVTKRAVAGTPEKSGEWVFFDSGKFFMGTDENIIHFEDAKPVHSVDISPFEISKTLVTMQQYEECVNQGKCTAPSIEGYPMEDCNWGWASRQNYPINCVSWEQANQYAWFKGARLPSEAEWEYAAKSGGRNQKYPWGDVDPTNEFIMFTMEDTIPVCSRPAGNTAQGLCDMTGNLSQWVQDIYKNSYNGAPLDGNAFEGAGMSHVTRGGSYNHAYGLTHLRVDYRDNSLSKSPMLGFRIVKANLSKPIDWVSMEGGKFIMGTDELIDGLDVAKPVHEVSLKTFKISKTDVTVGQYAGCVASGECTAPGYGGNCNWGILSRKDHPINCVTWVQVNQYAKFAGARLPTEAEWEYSATSGGKNHRYPWGNVAPNKALLVMDSKGTMPVCSKPAGNTVQGLCDMAGNVRQWVQDVYKDSYAGAPVDGSAVEGMDSYHVMRGGSFNNVSLGYTRDDNYTRNPALNSVGVGFRLAR